MMTAAWDLPHLVLLKFIPAKNDKFSRAKFAQDDLRKLFSERAGPAGH